MIDQNLNLEGLFTIVLRAMQTEDGYKFITRDDRVSTAKSPMGMFESDTIDNDLKEVDKIISFIEELNLNYSVLKRENKVFNIKIKPIYSDRDRIEIVDDLNYKFMHNNLDCVAKKLGKTTVDILSINNSKIEAFRALNLQQYKTLYIGDEVYNGNDRDIANLCTRKIAVRNVYETKALLDCFGRKDI